jgi:nucleotide-binding universal stress UspA family protein
MKVLIGVDGSPGGFAAVRLAGTLLDPQQDQVCLFYAPPELRLGSETHPQVLQRARDAMAAAVFDEARSRLPDGLRDRVGTLVGQQRPARGLIVAAEEQRSDLIVVGARGVSGLSELLLGSVSKAVVHAARVPVLVVREPAAGRIDMGPRVVLAYDGSDASRQAAAAVGRYAWPRTSQCTLLSVIEPMFVGQVPEWIKAAARDPEIESMRQHWAQEHDAERAARRREMEALAAALPEALRNAELVVAEGTAAEEICRVLQERQADLLVVGARGLGGWERLLVGSTTDRLLGEAPCSVLVVREHERP